MKLSVLHRRWPYRWAAALFALVSMGACVTGEDPLPSAGSGIGAGGSGAGGSGAGGSGGTSSGSGGAGGASGGAGGQGGISTASCPRCLQQQCPDALACISDPACMQGLQCAATQCLSGSPDLACFTNCYNGDVQAALEGLDALECILNACSDECSDLF